MQVEIGKIYEGTVKNITKYGAFVEIPNPDGDKIMGMVHISEVSRSYVNEIRDFVTEGQQVRVKAIGTNPQGKISLSMKAQCLGAEKAAGTLRDDLRGYALPVQAEQRRADVRHQAQHRAQKPFQAEIRICIHIAYAVHTGFQRFGQSFGAAFFA